MIYIYQIATTQLVSSLLFTDRHTTRLTGLQFFVFLGLNDRLSKYLVNEFFLRKKIVFCPVVFFLPKIPSAASNLLSNLLNLFLNIQLPIVNIWQSPYCHRGIYFRKNRLNVFVGDGFGILTRTPLNNGLLKGVNTHNVKSSKNLFRPIFLPYLSIHNQCKKLSIVKFVEKKMLNELLCITHRSNSPIFLHDLFDGFNNILVLTPSNFSENSRIRVEDEINLYLSDVATLSCDLDAIVLKPHPYGSAAKNTYLANTLSKKFTSIHVIYKPFLKFLPLEIFVAGLPSNVSATVLTYQTSWPSLEALELNCRIKVGFSDPSYKNLFFSHSVKQRISYQQLIPEEYLL